MSEADDHLHPLQRFIGCAFSQGPAWRGPNRPFRSSVPLYSHGGAELGKYPQAISLATNSVMHHILGQDARGRPGGCAEAARVGGPTARASEWASTWAATGCLDRDGLPGPRRAAWTATAA